MDKLKARFKEDPWFATIVLIGGVIVLTRLVGATASLVESSAITRAARI